MTTRRTFLKTAAALAVLPLSVRAGGHGRLGEFKGASGHTTTGTAEIAGNQINLLADFRFDGAPDPKVALGKNGFVRETLMGPLKSDSGKQSYTAPAGIDTGEFNEVWIWCEKFNVPLGVARIK